MQLTCRWTWPPLCRSGDSHRVVHRDDHVSFTQLLLDRGADPNVRASLRARLEKRHGGGPLRDYRDVTPLVWGQRYHAKIFVSRGGAAPYRGVGAVLRNRNDGLNGSAQGNAVRSNEELNLTGARFGGGSLAMAREPHHIGNVGTLSPARYAAMGGGYQRWRS